MFYRRKILLALIEVFEGQVKKIDFQKLLLLFNQDLKTPAYEFLPYLYGCYSYEANWDLGALCLKGLISESKDSWILEKKDNFLSQLKPVDKSKIIFLAKKYKDFKTKDLQHYTYVHLPYYAIKSKKLKQVLSAEEMEIVKAKIPKNESQALYTIGYEGISLEKYFNKLILKDVKVLCDVRKNPLSRKFGFSKSTLQKVCSAMGIKYVHIPELGIESNKRQNLNSQKDYNALFKEYETQTLSATQIHINKIIELLHKNKRVALTCFEAHYCQCHRGILAHYITQQPDWDYTLKHL